MSAGAASGALLLPSFASVALADPKSDGAQWIANHVPTRLMGADGDPVAWLPKFSHMRILRGLNGGILEVYVPRLGLVGRIPVSAIGPVGAPAPDDLRSEMLDAGGPPLVKLIGMPGRNVGGGNLRLWPNTQQTTLLRTIGHNAPLRVISSVEGDDGEEWYHVNLLNDGGFDAIGDGYLHNSVVRLPRGLQSPSPDRADMSGRWIQADIKDPAIVVAYEDGAPIWSTMAIKGVATFKTPLGFHHIVRRVANETMNSETLYPPIPRASAGGYYLKNVLWTQYFSWGGESIHYNYWSSNFGYAGSHGCLGMGYADAKFMWEWADIGTPVHVFA